MDHPVEFTPARNNDIQSRLFEQSTLLLSSLPTREPVTEFTNSELTAAKSSLQKNILRHEREFPHLTQAIKTTADAIIDGDLKSMQKIFKQLDHDPKALDTVADELDRNLGLMGIRVRRNIQNSQSSIDILRFSDSNYLSIPTNGIDAPSVLGPVIYKRDNDFALEPFIQTGNASPVNLIDRIRRTIIAWQKR